MEKYLDKTLTPKERAEDLLSRMTLQEKVKQISCTMVPMPVDHIEDVLSFENGIGQVAVMGGKDTPQSHAESIRKIQDKVMDSSRFRIPAVMHCEALSGPTFPNALTFPTSISLGATFEPELVKEMGTRIRRQMRAVGVRQALSPVFDVTRDHRWGRINETYGNDPTLAAEMGCAFVEGIQGLKSEDGIAATAKHFLGYSATEGGVNMARTALTHRELREVYAKPFEAAIKKAGLLSVMNSYAEWEGQPICASPEILTDLLRKELGFEGVVVSDYMSIDRLVNNFHVAENMEEAAAQCLASGLDIECPNESAYNENLIKAVEDGLIEEKYVDISCLRSLELKFKLGLFENPYPLENVNEVFFDPTDDEKSLEAARKAMTLVKNDGILPIQNKNARIVVIGPTGNSLRKMWSTYTALAMEEMMAGLSGNMAGVENDATSMFEIGDHPEIIEPLARKRYPQAMTIFEALSKKYPNVQYIEGCDYLNPEKQDIATAVAAAKNADIVIMTVGGKNGYGPGATNGEGIDSASYGLPGAQEALLEAVGNVNSNMVVVHTDAKALVSPYAYEHANAILEGWLCCTYAGQVIAEVIAGETNPGGRLQQDVPYDNGILTYHYQNNASHYRTLQALGSSAYHDCKEVTARPFGYGLSYTQFEYHDAKLNVAGGEIPTVEISVNVTNTGDRSGEEVVQIYGKDPVASVVRPYKELLGFKRLSLDAGETKKVIFKFRLDMMSFEKKTREWICEKGEYLFYVAKHSDDEEITLSYWLDEDRDVVPGERDFFAEAITE